MVKDFIEIKDRQSLDSLIERLIEVRDSIPGSGETEVKMRGDDIFGRKLSISYHRPQTEEEAECDARYAAAYKESRERELAKLHDELGYCPLPPHRRGGQLRIVA
jgi:hypothetical protein